MLKVVIAIIKDIKQITNLLKNRLNFRYVTAKDIVIKQIAKTIK